MTFEEANGYLDEVADELPQEVFTDLNGGIVLLPDIKYSPQTTHGDLFILGTYNYEPRGMGRYIAIYYGSFLQVNRGRSLEDQKKALKDVLTHELTHHLESMAGVRDLEVKDEIFMENYKKLHGEENPPKKGHGGHSAPSD